MRLKRPRVASLGEVVISRDADAAIIAYREPGFRTTHFTLGPEVHQMTDREILDRFNDSIRATEALAASYHHVAVEIPSGRPQIEYFTPGNQWTPRGDVLRCVIDDGGPGGMPIIHIDDQELSWTEFGRLLCTYAGWGMRVIFVPDDRVDEEPDVEVREPEDERRFP
jgi:hypothetical protein